jgi:hypothetical protein
VTRTTLKRGVVAALTCLVVQALLIWWLFPTPTDFLPTRSVSGTYIFDGGTLHSRSTSKIGNASLFCAISYFGPEDGCSQRLDGKVTTASLASYRHLFGTGEVVVELVAADGDRVSYTSAVLMRQWRSISWLVAIQTSLIAAILVCTASQAFFERK